MKRFFLGSCFKTSELNLLSMRVANEYDPDLMLFYGDFPYTRQPLNRFGYNTLSVGTSLANNTNVDLYRDHHSQIRSAPYNRTLVQREGFRYMWDDHETPLDDGANDLTFYQTTADENGGATWSGTTTAQDLANAWAAARTAAVENMTNNPANMASGIDPDAQYWSEVLGQCTYIVTDPVQYRSAKTATDDANKKMLGDLQEAWVIDTVNSATTPFVFIVTKPIFESGGNRDTYAFYQTERDRICSAITRSGVCFLAGDQHYPCVGKVNIGGTDFWNIIGCPTAQTLNPQSGPIVSEAQWKWGGVHQNAAQAETRAAILVEDDESGDYVRIRLLSPHSVDHWCGYMYSGSNDIVYPTRKTA